MARAEEVVAAPARVTSVERKAIFPGNALKLVKILEVVEAVVAEIAEVKVDPEPATNVEKKGIFLEIVPKLVDLETEAVAVAEVAVVDLVPAISAEKRAT